MHRFWERSQDQVFELDSVVGERIHEVEMEVAEELWVVLEDDEHHVHSRRVEAAHRRRGYLTWHEVTLDEGEAAD